MNAIKAFKLKGSKDKHYIYYKYTFLEALSQILFNNYQWKIILDTVNFNYNHIKGIVIQCDSILKVTAQLWHYH